MQEYLLHPITLLCLGIISILVSLLFFYFKRTISVLEKAQMDQARVLQSFIANMEMSSMAQYGGARSMNTPQNPQNPENPENPSNVSNSSNTLHEAASLIDVSDDESSDEEDESSDESSDEDNESRGEDINDIDDNDESVDNTNDTVKVIQLDGNNLEEIAHFEIKELVHNSDDEESDDEDSDDEDSDDEEDSNIKHIQPIQSSSDNISDNDAHLDSNVQVMSVAEQLNIVKPQTIDYKTLTVSALRELAETSGLIEKGDKKNKKELIKLLEESV